LPPFSSKPLIFLTYNKVIYHGLYIFICINTWSNPLDLLSRTLCSFHFTIHISRPMISQLYYGLYLYTYINTWSKTLDFILGMVLLLSRPYYINGPILTRSDIYFNSYTLQSQK